MIYVTTHLGNGVLKQFSFAGRTGRAEFWTFFAANLVMFLACLGAASLMSGAAATSLTAIGIVVMSFGNLASGVRRLHDTNRSGWWIATLILPVMAFVLLYFFAKPGVSGPTRFDDAGGMPERTPDHFTRAGEQRLA